MKVCSQESPAIAELINIGDMAFPRMVILPFSGSEK